MESRNSYSAENLYGYIDGGAELFLEFGFKELKTVHLTRGKAQLSVEMYQMTEIMSALGIYLAKCSPETPMDGVVPRNSGDRYQLAVVRGCWFIFINNFDGNRSHLQQMRQLANQLAAQIPDKLMAWPCPLDRKRLVKGSVRLARGPVALQSVYTLGEGDILQLNRQNWAMVADYRSKGKTETLVLAVYADEPFARKVFSSLLKNLDPYLKVIRSNETAFIFQDYAGEYGIASIHGRILDIRLHVISVPEM
ncbi:MAG: hypothetical protein CO090_03180 [Acidobacteria bacterium CG_4_9_14_3_um_filter_49_7]|nr:MAG: hypothetical protein CO090_03180 [Acidobacteria bacterium CG_4_9_14_3_um_filter_49_7]